MRVFWISLVILLAFASCSPVPSSPESIPAMTPTMSQLPIDATQSTAASSAENPALPINTPDFSQITPLPAETNPFIQLAEADLADRLKISTGAIHFLKISDIDWQDITQGCAPTPGQTLTKGKLSGYRIWLETGGKDYAYHVGLDNRIFLCPD